MRIFFLLSFIFAFFAHPPVAAGQEWWRAIYDGGIALIEKGDLKAAEAKFDEIIASDAKAPHGYIGLGLVEDKHNPGSLKARNYFKKAISVDNNCAEAYYRLGLHYQMEKHKLLNVHENLRQAVRKDPKHILAWLKLAEVQMEVVPTGRVFDIFRNALAHNPESRQLYKPFLEAALWYHKNDEAVSVLKKLAETHPDEPRHLYNLARLYFDTEYYTESFKSLDRLFRQAPKFSPSRVQYLRAQNHFLLNDLQQGQSHYESALESIRDTLDAATIFREVCYIMRNDEYDELQQTPIAELNGFYRRFWRSRDPDHSTIENERLQEHYQRLAYARKHYRRYISDPRPNEALYEQVHPFDIYNVHGQKLLRQGDFTKALHLKREIDDLGLIYIRHGLPDASVTSVDGLPAYFDKLNYESEILNEMQLRKAELDLQAQQDEGRYPRDLEINQKHFRGSLWVPKPYEGESLISADYFQNLPQNISWKYAAKPDRDEMIFHFKKFGGLVGWIIEAIPYTVAERERLDPRYTQLGKSSFERSPTAVSASNHAAEIAKWSKRHVETALTTETTSRGLKGEPLDFPMHFTSFKGNGLNTSVESYYGVHGSQTTLDANGSLQIRRFIGLYDTRWNEAIRILKREAVPIGLTQKEWSESGYTEFERFAVPPGRYQFEIQMSDLTSGRIGVYRGEYHVPDYASENLMMSDVLISGRIGPAGPNSKYNKGSISFSPRMFTAFDKNEDIGLYFEIYNLESDKDGQTNFSVSTALQRLGATETSLGQIVGFFKSLFGSQQEIVGTQYNYRGKSNHDKLYMNLRLQDGRSGAYELVVEATDLAANESASKTVRITIK